MEFTETEDRSTLRKFARDVAERELAPRATHWDETEEFPQASWDALKTAGLFGVTVSEDYGGMGVGDVEAAIVLEELGRADVSSAILAPLIFNGPPRAIEHPGNQALKEKWLPMAASGEALFCIGITEPDAGSAANLMRSHLTDDGNGGYRLNAYKNYVTGGHKAAACLVWTRFPGGEGAKGVGAVVVDLSAQGVSVAGTHKKMGLRGCTEAELAFDDVRIEADDVLLPGNPDDTEAFKTLLAHLNHERCGNAAMCLGAAQGALEYAIRYMNERVIGGRPLADLQGPPWKIAAMATQPARRPAGPPVEDRRHGHPTRRRPSASLPGRGHGRFPRHPSGAGDGDGQDGRQPGRQVRLRRGHPAPWRLRLQPRVSGRARLPR